MKHLVCFIINDVPYWRTIDLDDEPVIVSVAVKSRRWRYFLYGALLAEVVTVLAFCLTC